jgi:hypothetical protein
MIYVARISASDGRKLYQSAEYPTREAAALAAFAARPYAKRCTTGYGVGGNFDIREHRRADMAHQIGGRR